MAKFTKKKKKGMDEISTASLPDIVFMLLFFFMLVTVLKSEDPLTEFTPPQASELFEISDPSLVKYINIGKAFNTGLYGESPVIQLDDAIASVDRVQAWVAKKKEELPENKKKKMIVGLKVDQKTKMGIVSDVKQELRKAGALKLLYSAQQRERTGSDN